MSYCVVHPCSATAAYSGVKLETYVKVVTGNTDISDEELPIATEDTLGVIKVGDGLIVDENGVLSLDPEESCDCGDDQIIDGGDSDGDLDWIHYLDGGTAAGVE